MRHRLHRDLDKPHVSGEIQPVRVRHGQSCVRCKAEASADCPIFAYEGFAVKRGVPLVGREVRRGGVERAEVHHLRVEGGEVLPVPQEAFAGQIQFGIERLRKLVGLAHRFADAVADTIISVRPLVGDHAVGADARFARQAVRPVEAVDLQPVAVAQGQAVPRRVELVGEVGDRTVRAHSS